MNVDPSSTNYSLLSTRPTLAVKQQAATLIQAKQAGAAEASAVTKSPQPVPLPAPVPGQSDLTPSPPHPRQELNELFLHWGRTESPQDLDGSGRVGIQDLLMMLRNWPQQPRAITDLPGANDGGSKPPTVLSDSKPPPTTLSDSAPTGAAPSSVTAAARTKESGAGAAPSSFTEAAKAREPGTAPPSFTEAAEARDPRTAFVASEPRERVADEHEDRPDRGLTALRRRVTAEHMARMLQHQAMALGSSAINDALDDPKLGNDQKSLILDRIASMHPRGMNLSVVG